MGREQSVSILKPALLHRELRGRRLRLARRIVVFTAVLIGVAAARWLTRWSEVRLTEAQRYADLAPKPLLEAVTIVSIAIAILAVLVWWGLAFLVYRRRSRDLYGLYLALAFFCCGAAITDPSRFTPLARSDDAGFVAPLLMLANAFVVPWIFLFPDGRLVPRWAIVPIVVWVGWYLGRMFVPALDPRGPWLLLWMITPLLAVGSVVYRYLRRSSAVQRQQIKWPLVAGVLYIPPWIVSNLLKEVVAGTSEGGAFLVTTIGATLYALALLALPIALAIGIFRQGLFDLDFVINRAVAYGALSVIITLLFALLGTFTTRALAAITGQRTDIAVIAVGLIVAILFIPIKTAVIRIADRFKPDQRVLAIVVVDLLNSGDAAGQRHADPQRLRDVAEPAVESFGGTFVDRETSALRMVFTGPGRAIRCAQGVVSTAGANGLDVRAAAHIGELELLGGRASGDAVDTCARIATLASLGEVLVTGTLRDVVAGSDIEFASRRTRTPDRSTSATSLFSVTRAA